MTRALPYFLILVFVIVGFSAQAQGRKRKKRTDTQPAVAVDSSALAPMTADRPKEPLLVFEVANHDFGRIEAGEVVSYDFVFENAGGAALHIEQVKVSCGCTVSEYSDKPVRPGEKGFIRVTFNSAGKLGPQEKTITVYSDAIEPVLLLKLFGEVNSSLLPERRGGSY